MKKLYLMSVFLAVLLLPVFGQNRGQEEIGYLLFLPNSSGFMNESQAMSQLDTFAANLKAKNLEPGQIHVRGYCAVAANRVEPVNLSLLRAISVVNELKKRGIPGDRFSGPQGMGEVDTWGNNSTDAEKTPNRRVIISVDGIIAAAVLPAPAPTPTPVPTPAPAPAAVAQTTASTQNTATDSGNGIPWYLWLLLLLLIIFFIIFFLKRRKKDEKQVSTGAGAAVIAAPVAAATIVNDSTNGAAQITRSKFMTLEIAIRQILSGIPADHYVDVHTIIQLMLQDHDDVYITNVGNYTAASQYHSKISSIIAQETDLVEMIGNSYSRNIHYKFGENHLFRRKKA